MRDLLVVAGVIVVLVLLLAVFVEPAQAHQAGVDEYIHKTEQNPPAEDGGSAENADLICLALVGGTALLAGLVWMGKLRMRADGYIGTSGAASAKRGAQPPPRAG